MRTMTDTDFSRFTVAAEGAYISDDGFYCCESCEVVLYPTGKVITDDDGRNRAIWECTDCGTDYDI